MRWRTFIAGLAGTAAFPHVVRAQRNGKPSVIGSIGPNTEAIDRPRINAFIQRLSDLGWTEGRNIAVDIRSTDGVVARVAEIAMVFAQRPVDLIVTAGDGQVVATKKAASTVPIVFAAAGDPVGNGLVGSLSRPGGNITGQSILLTDSVGKRFDLLRDLLPGIRRIGLIGNLENSTVEPEWKTAQSQARALDIETIVSAFTRAEEVTPAIDRLKGRVDALYVCQDPLVSSVISEILRGTKPADIPVEQPTQFNLVINLKTANALGLKVPDILVNRADQVIE